MHNVVHTMQNACAKGGARSPVLNWCDVPRATCPSMHTSARGRCASVNTGATCSATLQYAAQHAPVQHAAQRYNIQRNTPGATCSAHHASCIMRPLQDPQRTARSHGACNQHAVHRCRAPSGAHRSMPVPPVSLSDCSKAFSVLWYLQPPAMGPVSTTAHSGNRCAHVLGSASSTRTSGVGCQH